MLRRNIDTKAGLVNGVIGTILTITACHVTVQFDHISTPCNVEMVKSSHETFMCIESSFL